MPRSRLPVPDDPDATVRLPRTGPARDPVTSKPAPVAARKRGGLAVAGAAVLALAMGLGGAAYWAWPGPATPAIPVASVAPVPLPVAPPPLPALTEAELLQRAPDTVEAYRFAPQPGVVVLVFPSMQAQGDMLNRIAALVEKSGYPRDRIMDQPEMATRIAQDGVTAETFYYGHDYRAADVLRFLALLRQSTLQPSAGEQVLAQFVSRWGWTPGTNGAVISLVRDGAAFGLDADSRATILRHELSHGFYFTDPTYVRYVATFWDTVLTDAERERFKAFLSGEGYDVSQHDLLVNETQAYLMHTRNPQFFNARAVGIPQSRLDLLRGLFLTGMPPSWLRDCTTPPPVRAPRRRRQRGLGEVRRTRTKAARRAPPRLACSKAGRSALT